MEVVDTVKDKSGEKAGDTSAVDEEHEKSDELAAELSVNVDKESE